MLKSKEPPIPGPAYMSNQQMAQYLAELRRERPARPSGSRPAPPSKFNSLSSRSESTTSQLEHGRSSPSKSSSMPIMSPASNSIIPTQAPSRSPFAGRPLARAPTPTIIEEEERPVANKVKRRPSYMENGTRWMERQETKSLREALEDMDLEEERRIHFAAQDEAAELVYKHMNPDTASAAFANPDLKDYRSHLRKGSYQRSHSSSSTSSDQRSASNYSQSSSTSSDNDNTSKKPILPTEQPRKVSPPSANVSVLKRRDSSRKSYDPLAQAVARDIAVAHRRSSSGSMRIVSGEKKMFMSPNDKIWEDPSEEDNAIPGLDERPSSQASVVRVNHVRITEERMPSLPPTITSPLPSYVRKNPFARVRAQNDRMERANSAPTLPTVPLTPEVRHDRIEIQRNPPTQSRNPWYVSNEPLPPTPPAAPEREADEVAPKGSGSRGGSRSGTPTRDGKEIRGDDIRAATSKTRKDYSPNLPRPTMVSDKPGRPIVSFEQRAKEVVLEAERSVETEMTTPRKMAGPVKVGNTPSPRLTPAGPSSSSRNVVPQINVEEAPHPSIPTINLPDDPSIPPIPSIVFPDDDDATPSIKIDAPSISINDSPTRCTPPRSRIPQRPFPQHSASAPAATKSTPHYSPSVRTTPGTLCAHCALPIAGRILSASGARFHPACFVCHTCSTNLEHVAFYPEPESSLRERCASSSPDDPTPDLRFYCHLDYHESFSPRCKTCTTPIESAAILACGNTYHSGHFFCAQCGDPFDDATPFVEKEGYAWCVGCHSHRTAPKCGGCRKPVLEVVVKALGREWHEGCFCCGECGGGFGEEGRFFLQGEGKEERPVCVGCEERRLKA